MVTFLVRPSNPATISQTQTAGNGHFSKTMLIAPSSTPTLKLQPPLKSPEPEIHQIPQTKTPNVHQNENTPEYSQRTNPSPHLTADDDTIISISSADENENPSKNATSNGPEPTPKKKTYVVNNHTETTKKVNEEQKSNIREETSTVEKKTPEKNELTPVKTSRRIAEKKERKGKKLKCVTMCSVKVPLDAKPGEQTCILWPDNSILGVKYPPDVIPGGVMVVVAPGNHPPLPSSPSPATPPPSNVNQRKRSNKQQISESLESSDSKKPKSSHANNEKGEKEKRSSTESRVGKLYQATELPVATGNVGKINYNRCSSRKEKYYQIWDPKLANSSQDNAEDIDAFIQSLPFKYKEAGMLALHNSGYRIEKARQELNKMNLPINDVIPCTPQMLSSFHTSILESRKDFQAIAVALRRSRNACLEYYYNKYKQSDEYQELKMCLRDESDECNICGEYGDLLCCDGCNRTYHLGCLDPPLKEVPDGDWFCSLCTQDGSTPKSKLGLYHKNHAAKGSDQNYSIMTPSKPMKASSDPDKSADVPAVMFV